VDSPVKPANDAKAACCSNQSLGKREKVISFAEKERLRKNARSLSEILLRQAF